ncbi:hypothetical protein (Partial), partial [Seminavis robusta]|eukprot:Sro841_g209460.1 n/a (525) ;mRNA; r:165-2066
MAEIAVDNDVNIDDITVSTSAVSSVPADFSFDDIHNVPADNPESHVVAETIIMEVEEDGLVGDIRDNVGKSAEKKQKSALKHFDGFLRLWFKHRGEPYRHYSQLFHENTEDSNRFWDALMGGMFSYFATGCNGELGFESVNGYASSIKAYYTDKWRHNTYKCPVFGKQSWATLRRKLRTLFEERARQSGQKLTNPHQASTQDDMMAMVYSCLWLATGDAAVFLLMNIASLHYSGRSSEVALNRWSHLSSWQICELHFKYTVLSTYLKRQKLGEETNLTLFPHRENFFEDIYFGMIYRIIMLPDNDDYLFPKFAEKALHQSKEGRNDSKLVPEFVSQVFAHDTANRWSQTVRELLVASMLRYFDKVETAIQNAPHKDFGKRSEDHPFISTIYEYCSRAGVSETTFEAWQAEVKEGFFGDNLPALQIKLWPDSARNNRDPRTGTTLVDRRCLMDHYNTLAHHTEGLHLQVVKMRQEMSELRTGQAHLIGMVQAMLASQQGSRTFNGSGIDSPTAVSQSSPGAVSRSP